MLAVLIWLLGGLLMLAGTLEIRAVTSYASASAVSAVGPVLLIAGFTLIRVGFLV